MLTDKRRIGGVLLSGLACWLLGGCYDAKQVNQFLLELPAPVAGEEYRVLPPDVIAIASRGVEEINATQQVRPDGKINLPLIGEVLVAGKTPTEIEDVLKKKALEYYEQVDATVTVTGYNSQSFYVLGEVTQPGPIAWTGGETVLSALAISRPTVYAWPERIILNRGDEPHEGGRATTKPTKKFRRWGVEPPRHGKPRQKMTFNLMAMVKDGDMSRNVRLRPNDIIYVQPNPFGRLARAVEVVLLPVPSLLEAVRTPATVRRSTRVNDNNYDD